MRGLDSLRHSITKGDSVKIVDGPNKGKKGTIVHLHKNIVYLYNPEQSSNNGLFVDKTRNLIILGAELLTGPNDDLTKRKRSILSNPRRDELFNKLVRIKSGPYKGYEGLVVSVDKGMAKVELSSKAKTVNVDRGSIVDATLAAVNDTFVEIPIAGAKTPAYCPQSPHWISSTPAPQSPGYTDGKLTVSLP